MHTRRQKCRSHCRAPSLVHFPCVTPSKLCLASAQAHVSLSSSVNMVYFTHLSLVRLAEEIARTTPGPQSHTPPADPKSNPQATTPEPEGSKSTIHFTLQSLTHLGHWVFTLAIQSLLYRKTIPFYIRDTHKSADRSLQQYEKATGRTIPELHPNSPPKEGEVILNVVKCSHSMS